MSTLVPEQGLRRDAVVAFFMAMIVAFVYWPGVNGFWGRDDFGVLAFVRLLGSPWPLFVHDHFPAAGWVFRPLGFASMWLSQELFGTDYRANAMFDLALHIGVSLALFCLLRRAGIARAVAFAVTSLFAAHPAAIGTALWWNGRFDLLASLFILIALYAAVAYRLERRLRMLALVLVAALAAMLCKEIGLVAVAGVSVLWLLWARSDPGHRATALRAVLLSWLCALLYLVWRWLVLGEFSHILTTLPLQDLMTQGLLSWLQNAPGYLTFWPRLHALSRVALAAALAGASLTAVMTVAGGRLRPGLSQHADLILCGLCLLVLPALLQVPVAVWNATALQADVSAIEAAMQSRLYYLGIIGTTIMLGGVLGALWERADKNLRIGIGLPCLFALVAFAVTSHGAAHAFARRSLAISAVARDATAAVARIELPQAGCHVAFLDMQFPAEWSVYVSADSIVKALSPDLDHVKHCWFHSNSPAYFQAAPATAADAAPYHPYQTDGKPAPWRTVGGVVIAYLSAPENPDLHDLAQMIFLRYRNGQFEDVSADVVAGRLAVHLQ
jgi:hypothetical protein